MRVDPGHAEGTAFTGDGLMPEGFLANQRVDVRFLKEGGEGSSYAVPIADKVMRAYFELTGARQRGTILREDQLPIGKEHPAPSSGIVISGSPTAEPDENFEETEDDFVDEENPIDEVDA